MTDKINVIDEEVTMVIGDMDEAKELVVVDEESPLDKKIRKEIKKPIKKIKKELIVKDSTEKVKEEKEIRKGRVILVQKDEKLGTNIAILDLNGTKGVIKEEDLDYEVKWRSLVPFVGKEIFYTIKEIDKENEIIYCSRKEAQELMRAGVIERLESGEEIVATMSSGSNYGAYFDIDGIYCTMKNTSFSDDHVNIKDIIKAGDSLTVKLVKIGKNSGRITVEPVVKYELPQREQLVNFEENQVIVGRIVTVKPWGIFVELSPGVDALCSVPPTIDVEVGLEVVLKINEVVPDKSRIRGKILKSIQ